MITASEAKRVAEESIKRDCEIIIREAFAMADEAVMVAAVNKRFTASFLLPTSRMEVAELIVRELEKLSYSADFQRNGDRFQITLEWK